MSAKVHAGSKTEIQTETLLEIKAGVGGRDERDLLTMSIGDNRAECFWNETEFTGDYSPQEAVIIVTTDASLLDELREAGWEVQLAPPGIYHEEIDRSTEDCIVMAEGAIPIRQPRLETT